MSIITINLTYDGKEIMSTLQDITDRVAKLTADIQAEKTQVQGMLSDLRAQIQTLQDTVNNGQTVTPEQLQSLSDSLDAADTAVQNISEPETPATTG